MQVLMNSTAQVILTALTEYPNDPYNYNRSKETRAIDELDEWAENLTDRDIERGL